MQFSKKKIGPVTRDLIRKLIVEECTHSTLRLTKLLTG